jgi:hypothetical protein
MPPGPANPLEVTGVSRSDRGQILKIEFNFQDLTPSKFFGQEENVADEELIAARHWGKMN